MDEKIMNYITLLEEVARYNAELSDKNLAFGKKWFAKAKSAKIRAFLWFGGFSLMSVLAYFMARGWDKADAELAENNTNISKLVSEGKITKDELNRLRRAMCDSVIPMAKANGMNPAQISEKFGIPLKVVKNYYGEENN